MDSFRPIVGMYWRPPPAGSDGMGKLLVALACGHLLQKAADEGIPPAYLSAEEAKCPVCRLGVTSPVLRRRA